MRKKILLIITVSILILINPALVRGNTAGIEVFDTIAGFETLIKVFKAGSSGSIRLTDPLQNKRIIKYEDEKGDFNIDISGNFVRKAGDYRVEIFNPQSNEVFAEAGFHVFPGDLSPKYSGIYALKQSANVREKLLITVKLQDEYGNPISNHNIALISSRNSDSVAPISKASDITDSNGLTKFYIYSNTPGESILSAADRTQNLTLKKRLAVRFKPALFNLGGASVLNAVGGDDYKLETRSLALADAEVKQVRKLEITELPDQTTANENISFKVRAVDSRGFVLDSYSGTVKFVSSDTNALLPGEYTFKNEDMGEHAFELSLSFKTVGKQTLRVKDKNNAEIKGEKEIEVLAGRSSADEAGVRITSPLTGKYGVNTIEIEGQASANAQVSIFDNGQQIGVTRSANTGRFSFTTPKLEDGRHTLSAESNGQLSEEIEIIIDATGAKIENLKIEPNPAGPSQNVSVELTAEQGLASISITFNGIVVDMDETRDNPGTYTAVITAPDEAGDYPVDITLTDSSGNESTKSEAALLKVDENLRTQGLTFRVPSKVTGVQTLPGYKAVKLTWRPSTDNTGIAFYKIYYGIDRQNLNRSVKTSDAATTWEVRNLENGVQYFFQVAGVDTEGNKGHQKSDVAGAVPNDAGRDGVGELYGEYVYPPEGLPEDGPEAGILLLAPALAYLYRKFKASKDVIASD